MQEPLGQFGDIQLRPAGFALHFRQGECRAPELVEETAGKCVYRIGLDIDGATHWYQVGQSLVNGPAGVERRLWLERALGSGAAPDGLCAATLLLEIDGAKTVAVPMTRFLPGTLLPAALRRPRLYGERHEVARLVISGNEQDWREASSAVGVLFSSEGYVPPCDRPAWARTATIYEADISFHGTLAQLTARLDEIKSQGFNTVYLMPWHRGSYSTRDYQDWLTNQLCAGSITGAQLQRIIGEHFLSLPRGTWLTTYAQTHDTLAFAKRDPEGPAVAALFATLTLLSAGTMVFGGGWGMRARPSAAESEEYRRLFALKSQLGGVAAHDVSFPPTLPALFEAERPSNLGTVRVVTNVSAQLQPLPQGRLLYSRLGSPARQLLPYDTVVYGKVA